MRLKRVLNIFFATLMIVLVFSAYFPATILAFTGDETQYEKISDLVGLPSCLAKAGNNIFYLTNTGEGITDLYKTDGTDSGTLLLKTFSGEDNVYIYSTLNAIGNNIYFTAYTPTTGSELWGSDGTVDGTHILKDIYPGEYDGAYTPMYVMNDALYFLGVN